MEITSLSYYRSIKVWIRVIECACEFCIGKLLSNFPKGYTYAPSIFPAPFSLIYDCFFNLIDLPGKSIVYCLVIVEANSIFFGLFYTVSFSTAIPLNFF